MYNSIISVKDTSKSSNKTAPQIRSIPSFESRTYQTFQNKNLQYDKILSIREDPTIQLARMAVAAPIIHTPWIYQTTKDAPSDAPEFIRLNLESIRLWTLQTAVYGILDFGWQPFEVIYYPEDGQIWLDWCKPLLQEYTTILVYLNNGRFAGYVNEPTKVGEFAEDSIIWEEYALHTMFVQEGTSWYGHSVYDSLYDTQKYYDNVNKTADRYDRKIAGATWVVWYPVGVTLYNNVETPNDVIANEVLARLEASGAVAIPDEVQEFMSDSIEKEMIGKWRIELITSNSSTQSSFIDRLKYLDSLKMRAFGIPERSVLEGTHGTKAEAGEHTNIALGTIGTKHLILCEAINKYITRRLLTLNYGKEYRDCVKVMPAPIVSAHYETLKEIYRLIIQSPETLLKEFDKIDTSQIRSALDIPSTGVVKNG